MVFNLYTCPEAFKYRAHLIIVGNQFKLHNVSSKVDSGSPIEPVAPFAGTGVQRLKCGEFCSPVALTSSLEKQKQSYFIFLPNNWLLFTSFLKTDCFLKKQLLIFGLKRGGDSNWWLVFGLQLFTFSLTQPILSSQAQGPLSWSSFTLLSTFPLLFLLVCPTGVEQDSYFSKPLFLSFRLGEGVTFCGFLSSPRNEWRLCKEQSVCRAKSKAVTGFSSTRRSAMLLAWSIFLFLSSELDECVRVWHMHVWRRLWMPISPKVCVSFEIFTFEAEHNQKSLPVNFFGGFPTEEKWKKK